MPSLRLEVDVDAAQGERIDVTVYEDEDGDGTADNTEELDDVDHGENTYDLPNLSDDGADYWFRADLYAGEGWEAYVFEDGDAIQVSDDADQDFVFASGTPIVAEGGSDFVFIDGEGIGGADLDNSTPWVHEAEITFG